MGRILSDQAMFSSAFVCAATLPIYEGRCSIAGAPLGLTKVKTMMMEAACPIISSPMQYL